MEREQPDNDVASVEAYNTEEVASHGIFKLHQDQESPSQYCITLDDGEELETMDDTTRHRRSVF